jgi:hypothetical protein
MTGIELDFETAERITLKTLEVYLKTVESMISNGQIAFKSELDQLNEVVVPALKVVIKEFGG